MVHVFYQSTYGVWFLVTSAFISIFSMQCYADISVYNVSDRLQPIDNFKSYLSTFGPALELDGFEGVVIYNSSDGTGCNESSIDDPPTSYSDFKWILLLQRGDCTFVEKVRNAQKKNYDMVIVFNNSSSVESMHGWNSSDIRIPSVFVSQYTGLTIKSQYLYFKGFYLMVTDDRFPFDINEDLLIPFAIVVAVCFITMISFMICKCIRDRRRARRHRLPASSLRKIPTDKFSSKTSPYETCAICLDDYVDGEKLRILPCSHAYHTKCIDPWLTRNRRVCPICKRKVFAADETPIDGSESDSDSDNDERTPLVRSETSQPRQLRRAYLLSPENIFTPISHLAWQHHESVSSNGSSDASNHSGSILDLDDQALLASVICSINAADNGSNSSNILNSYVFPGTSSLQLPQNNNYNNVQNQDDDSS